VKGKRKSKTGEGGGGMKGVWEGEVATAEDRRQS